MHEIIIQNRWKPQFQDRPEILLAKYLIHLFIILCVLFHQVNPLNSLFLLYHIYFLTNSFIFALYNAYHNLACLAMSTSWGFTTCVAFIILKQI